jgi:hypothetical protein
MTDRTSRNHQVPGLRGETFRSVFDFCDEGLISPNKQGCIGPNEKWFLSGDKDRVSAVADAKAWRAPG